MDRLLKVGDKFKIDRRGKEYPYFVYEYKMNEGKVTLNRHSITLDTSTELGWFETQTRKGGWTRTLRRVTDRSFKRAEDMVWKVLSTTMTGGGTGHGPHDIYPDGHFVIAESTKNSSLRLKFFQSGAFIPFISKEDIIQVES